MDAQNLSLKINKLEIDQAPSVSQVFQGRLWDGIMLKSTNNLKLSGKNIIRLLKLMYIIHKLPILIKFL